MKYQFQSNPGEFSYRPALFTSAIKTLVSINFLIFLLQSIAKSESLFFPLFGLVPKYVWSDLMLWQPATYIFLHGSIWHVLINMFVLWMFGTELERLWGKKHFVKFYFYTGIGSGLVTLLFNYESTTPVVGASGSVYGVLLAYGLTYPNRRVYLYGIIPIKSLWFVIGIGFIAFASSFNNVSQVSHITHLAGMAIAYILIKKPINLNEIVFRLRKRFLEYQVNQKEKRITKEFQVEKNINRILDKINKEGFDKLSDQEQEDLYKNSQFLSKRKTKD